MESKGEGRVKDHSKISPLGNWEDLYDINWNRRLKRMIMNLVVRRKVGKLEFAHDQRIAIFSQLNNM